MWSRRVVVSEFAFRSRARVASDPVAGEHDAFGRSSLRAFTGPGALAVKATWSTAKGGTPWASRVTPGTEPTIRRRPRLPLETVGGLRR